MFLRRNAAAGIRRTPAAFLTAGFRTAACSASISAVFFPFLVLEKMKILYMRILVVLGFAVLLAACNHDKESRKLLEKANDNLYQFYLSNDTTLLFKAQKQLDSIKGKSYRFKVFNTKITLLMLQGKYKEGIEYVESMDEADFDKEYKKNMYLKAFEAMDCRKRGNFAREKELYGDIMGEILSYMHKFSDDGNDVVMDLFFIKHRIETDAEIQKDIAELRATGMYDAGFLEALANMNVIGLNNDSVVAGMTNGNGR